ncbi:alpha/beta hydrolase domain-containing protein [Yunchengibacter salinarum]|uniref:alpha/beta hydrolase domain-containing protein n=1 Tax=Yunchengibacter salinarum TaxID=3133399 RepID=UPI0035B5AAEE
MTAPQPRFSAIHARHDSRRRPALRLVMLLPVLVLAAMAATTGAARGAVTAMEILERTPFADGHAFGAAGPYDKIRVRLHFAVNPAAAHNAPIVDLDKAATGPDGKVNFSGEALIFAPRDPAKGNGTLIYDVTNRGRLTAIGAFNSVRSGNDPESLADAGNGFLFKRGFTVIAGGWNWDVPLDDESLIGIDLPVATGANGETLKGRIAHEIQVRTPAETASLLGIAAEGYPLVPDDPTAHLTVRDRPDGTRRLIPRDRWHLGGTGPDGEKLAPKKAITLQGGFRTDRIYELVITAKDPRVVGLGMAAIRDTLTHFRDRDRWGIGRTLVYGHSQSGRLIATMIHDGLHITADGNSAFDGAYIRVAGGGKGSFNHRFAQTTRHFSQWEELIYPTDYFPFTTRPTTDPLTGETASLLDRARAAGAVPKIFFTNTATEYWARAASLLHTDPAGQADVAPADNTRLYALLGAQHFHARWPHRWGLQSCVNPADKRPVSRALLLALDDWVAGRDTPPDSAYPTLEDGELGTADAYRAGFSAPDGVALPGEPLMPPRLTHGPRWDQGIEDITPPKQGPVFSARVPLTDANGNPRGGVPLAWLAAPLGSHLGYNPRTPERGGAGALSRWLGGFVPLARTGAEAANKGDPRPTLKALYGDRKGYEAAMKQALARQKAAGFLLAEEEKAVLQDWLNLYDRVVNRQPFAPGCGYLSAETE